MSYTAARSSSPPGHRFAKPREASGQKHIHTPDILHHCANNPVAASKSSPVTRSPSAPCGCQQTARAFAQSATSEAQSSTLKPLTRANSRVLCVTSVAASASAWQAIQRSLAPIGVP